jgi:crotonobetaine/carnitine-CoA ligase
VVACAAVPVRSEFAEDEIKLCVSLAPGSDLTPGGLVDFLTPLLPAFMVPRFVDLRDELPLTPTGKIQKAALRAEGRGDSWDRTEPRSA